MTAIAAPTLKTLKEARFDGIVLEGVSWDLYELMLRDLDGQHIQITYDRGKMVLMSPRPDHERWKTFGGRMVEALSEELNIPVCSLGSTTWRRHDLLRGLEPDECYYIQHEPQVRCRLDIDLTNDPPPDLALEVEVTHHPADRAGIYAALGVPELWRCDGQRIAAFRLGTDARYQQIDSSVAFPFLHPAELEQFLAMLATNDETSVIRAFRVWVRKNFGAQIR